MAVNRVNIKPRRSIRTRLLVLLLGMTLFAVISVTLIAINSANSTARSIENLSASALRSQAETSLLDLTRSSADQNDLILQAINRDTQKLAEYLRGIYSSPFWSGSRVFLPVEVELKAGAEGQYSNDPQAPTSVFVPNSAELDIQVRNDVRLSAYLDLVFGPTFSSSPNVEAIYFATPRNVVRYYPNIDLGSVLPPDFQATQRVWYSGSMEQDAASAHTWWTPAYLDATGLGVVTTAAIPIYSDKQELIGVIGFDVTLTEMKSTIENSRVLQSGYSFLIDNEGRAIALPEQGYQDILSRAPEQDEFGTDLINTDTPFADVIQKMTHGESGFSAITAAGQELFVAYAPLKSAGWSLASVVKSQDVLASVLSTQQEMENQTRQTVVTQILPISAIILIIMAAVGMFFINRMIKPVRELSEVAQHIGAGEWDVNVPALQDDEIGLLALAFRSMIDQLHSVFLQLEQRVEERTRDLDERAKQLQTAAEVGHFVATIRDLDELLPQITGLISEKFGFYHAGVFLLDARREYAVLRAANSEGGQRMLARNHKLKIGQEGIVGQVAATGVPHIALDVGIDAVFFNNPDMPNTRSEMALPLISGGRILGVLDIQSTKPRAFNKKDIEVLQVLADQVAIAIENARLFSENQAALDSARLAYNELSRQAWSKLLNSHPTLGYVCDDADILTPISSDLSVELVNTASDHRTAQVKKSELILPIKIRGTVTGAVRLKKPDDRSSWNAEEISFMQTIADQMGVALENARLHEQAQRRAERERMAGEISAKLRASNNPQEILQTAVNELRQALQINRVLSRSKPNGPAQSGDKQSGLSQEISQPDTSNS